jgi:tight adherence protein B
MSGEKKSKKEKYVPVEGILGPAEDYHIYPWRIPDVAIAALIGGALGVVVIYVFFASVPASAAAGVLGALAAQSFYHNYKKKRRLNSMLLQFKDMLESLGASYSAGKNTMDAFLDAKNDMIHLYGEKTDIVREIQIIIDGIANNLQVETMMQNWAKRSGLDDIENFAQVFSVANRQGSDMKRVVNESKDIIAQKIEIEMELETLLSGNKNELNVMMLMPVLIMGMMSVLGIGSVAENTPFNVALKAGCIALFGIAYLLGRMITNVKV